LAGGNEADIGFACPAMRTGGCGADFCSRIAFEAK
jgi:hypothetical protein